MRISPPTVPRNVTPHEIRQLHAVTQFLRTLPCSGPHGDHSAHLSDYENLLDSDAQYSRLISSCWHDSGLLPRRRRHCGINWTQNSGDATAPDRKRFQENVTPVNYVTDLTAVLLKIMPQIRLSNFIK